MILICIGLLLLAGVTILALDAIAHDEAATARERRMRHFGGH